MLQTSHSEKFDPKNLVLQANKCYSTIDYLLLNICQMAKSPQKCCKYISFRYLYDYKSGPTAPSLKSYQFGVNWDCH